MNDYESVQAELPEHTVTVGRYILHRQIARGGMATIHIARLMGDEGFSRIVAAKRLLPEFAEDSEFVAMFLDEARIASKVHHRNVVPVLDLVTTMGEVVLVQEYVHGVPLHWLMSKTRQHKVRIPVKLTVSIACQILAGLHAAHEMVDELGTPLNVVHRDVSPQNVMIASDGSARLLDFGVAKATMAAHVTREGTYKGKLAYSAPEQLRGGATRQSDIYSLSVLLWELLVGHRMHRNQGDAELVAQIMSGQLPTISEALETELEWQAIDGEDRRLLAAIEPIVKRGLSLDLNHRWSTASEMEEALLAVARPASSNAVSQWLKSLGKEYLDKHEGILAAEEQSWRRTSHAIGSRYTPLPGSIRTSTVPGIDMPSASGSLPRPPERKSNAAMFGVLGFLVVMLAVGITWLIRSPNADSKPQEPPVQGVQPLPAATLPAQPPEATVKRDVPAAPVPAAAAAVAPAPATDTAAAPTKEPDQISIGKVEIQAVKPAPAPAPPKVVRPAVRPQQQQQRPAQRQPQPTQTAVKKAPDPPPTTAPPATGSAAPPAPAAAKDNCNPPYYYEGSKKIFKPACL